jgi:hypothetical protein
VERSTRFSIVEHALGDVAERLRELVPGEETQPPDEPTRVALLKRVLDLNIEIMRAGGDRPTTDATELGPDDDDYPKSL